MNFDVLSDSGSDQLEVKASRTYTSFGGVQKLGEWVLLVIISIIVYNPLVGQHLFGLDNPLVQAVVTASVFYLILYLMEPPAEK